MGGIPVAMRHLSRPVSGCGWWWAGSWSRCDTFPAQCGCAGGVVDPDALGRGGWSGRVRQGDPSVRYPAPDRRAVVPR